MEKNKEIEEAVAEVIAAKDKEIEEAVAEVIAAKDKEIEEAVAAKEREVLYDIFQEERMFIKKLYGRCAYTMLNFKLIQ